MKHLHFVQSLETLQGGGLGAAALQLHLALRKSGNSSLVATRSPEFDGSWDGCHQEVRSGPPALYYSKAMSRSAPELVGNADWVHGHGLHVYLNYIFGKESRRQGKPCVIHAHGFLDPWILGRSRMKKRLVGLLFERRNLREARFMRALTTKEERQIRQAGIKCPVEVIPNGIDLEEIDATPEGGSGVHFEKKRPKRLMFLSRIHPKKGLDLLVPAWEKLSAEFTDWELAIVGPDEGGYQSEVEAMIRACSVQDSCTVLPPVSGATKHQVFKAADLFVLPSYSEGFPMAALEALAHRVPSVVTTECNLDNFASRGAVWECEPKRADLEATLKIAMKADAAERAQRSELGRRMLEEGYGWNQVARRLEEACHAHA